MTPPDLRQPPTLCGDRVLLRPTTLSDVEGLIAAYDDDETLRWFPYGIESEPPSHRTVAHALASGRQVLTQVERRTGRIVGTTSIYDISELHARAMIGYTWLSRSVRGTGFNREAKMLLLDHLFGTLGMRRVQLNVDDMNERSRRAVLALGASEEGALRCHARRRDGTWRTTIVYSIISDEWPSLRERLVSRSSA